MNEVTVIERTITQKSSSITIPSRDKPALLKVAAYCRVSTDIEEQLGSFQNQVKTYKEMILSNPEWEFSGIYADEGLSGTRADKRPGFQKMMNDCKEGKIDKIITKSISRFARNVVDSLGYARELKALGISIYFEEEHLNSTDSGADMLFTILSAVAEQESRNISEHTKWDIRSGFRRGIYRNPADLHLYGYTYDSNNNVMIVEEEADAVRMMYEKYQEGMSANEIASLLNKRNITTKKGVSWRSSTILSILTNEKYKGDVLMQKTFVQDFITHKSVKNEGQELQYYIKDAHPAIIDRMIWDAAQEEMTRRSSIHDPNGRTAIRNRFNSFTSKVYLKHNCHVLLTKRTYGNKKNGTWRCRYCRKDVPFCKNPFFITGYKNIYPDESEPLYKGISLNDNIIRQFFILAWNHIIDHLTVYTDIWNHTLQDEHTTSLQKIRAKQMLSLSASGSISMHSDYTDIVRTTLDRIEVIDTHHADVYFLDGTMITVNTFMTNR